MSTCFNTNEILLKVIRNQHKEKDVQNIAHTEKIQEIWDIM